MKTNQKSSFKQKVEEKFKQKGITDLTTLSEENKIKLLKELQLQQIELEVKNEELLLARKNAEKAIDKIGELYNFSSSCYLALDAKGSILELNLNSAKMLGKDRSYLLGKNIKNLISDNYKSEFNQFLKKVFKNDLIQKCLVEFKSDKPSLFNLDGLVTEDRKQCIISAVEVSSEKQNEITSNRIEETPVEIEQALIESEQRFRLMFENTPLPYQSLSPKGFFLDVNPEWLRILGYEKEEVIGKHFTDFMTKDSAIIVKDKFAGFLANGEVHEAIFTMLKKTGEEIIVSYEGKLGYDSLGRIKQTHCIFSDVTKQKNNEEAIRLSEQNYKNLFNANRDGISIFDIDEKTQRPIISEVNSASAKMLGYNVEEMIGKEPRVFEHNVDPQLLEERISKMKKNGSILFETELEHKNGKIIIAEISAFIVDYNKKPAIMNIVHDITEQKKMAQKLQKSEEQLRYALDAASDGLWDWNLKNDSVYWSPRAFIMLGFKPNEFKLNFEKWKGLVHPDDYEESIKIINNSILKTHEPFQLEFRYKTQNGNWVWMVSRGKPVEFENGKITRIVGTHVDITERKNSENELLRAKRVAEESEEKFRLLHENAGLGIAYYSPDGIVLSFNSLAAKNMNGVPKDFEGKSIFEIVPQKIAEVYFNRFKKACNTDEIAVYEDLVPLQNGNKWFSSTFTKIENSKKEILGIQIISQEITNQKMAEESLKKSELEFRTVWENSASGMRITNEEGIIVRVNEAYCKMVGKSKEELEGNILSSVYAQGDREYIQKKHQERFRKKTVKTNFEKEITLWNYEKLWIHVSNSFLDTNSEEALLLGVFTDITQRKNAELERENTQNKFHMLFEQSPIGMALVDHATGEFLEVNSSVLNATGYSKEEFLNLSYWDITPREYEQQEIEQLKALNETGYFGPNFNEYIRKDGTRYPIAINGALFTNLNGQKVVWRIIEDISERKKTEEMLLKNARLFELITETSIDGFWRTDTNGNIKDVNKALCKMTGYTRDEMLGLTISDLDVNEDHEAVKSHINKLEAIGYDKFETQFKTKDGSIINFEVNSTYFSEMEMVFAFFSDITDRKKTEREIISQMDEINRYNKLMVGREVKMIELKEEVNNLLEKNGNPPKYKIVK